jgi:DNA-binding response OmpR family regulator
MLPGGVDGLSIIATIRNLGKTTPIIVLSALASLDERVRVNPQTNVIDVQISRVRRKIDKDFSPQLLRTVRGIGYMISAGD